MVPLNKKQTGTQWWLIGFIGYILVIGIVIHIAATTCSDCIQYGEDPSRPCITEPQLRTTLTGGWQCRCLTDLGELTWKPCPGSEK